MMTRITSNAAGGSKLVPFALFLTLALALGVWAVPMPFLRANKIEIVPRIPKEAAQDNDKNAMKATVEAHEWVTLAAGLEGIRKPPPQSDEPEFTEGDAPENTDENPRDITEHLPPLTWRYIGYIAQPNGRIAGALQTEDGTRMVYVGAELHDHTDPRQRKAQITEITRESVTIRRAGNDVVLKIEPPQDTIGFSDFIDRDS